MKVTLKGKPEGIKAACAKIAKGAVLFMHTLDNHPAFFSGDQICYAPYRRHVPLVESLTQIKRDQRASEQYRNANGYQDHSPKYGYIRVVV
jgi:hypothetical protein